MSTISCYKDPEGGYIFAHKFSENARPADFVLHNHKDMFEVVVFLKGNATFRVEGTSYTPAPWDVIITNYNEMHRMCINREGEYDRIVFNIKDGFFTRSGCGEFNEMFLGRAIGADNLIRADTDVRAAVERFCAGVEEDAPPAVMKSLFISLLYYIQKKAALPSTEPAKQAYIKDIIVYLNENIRSQPALDDIAEHFFINKYHLCHIFRRHTGMSINRYVNYKRLLLVRELCAGGMSLTDAAAEAGFNNYSGFYKVYRREFGISPREDLK